MMAANCIIRPVEFDPKIRGVFWMNTEGDKLGVFNFANRKYPGDDYQLGGIDQLKEVKFDGPDCL